MNLNKNFESVVLNEIYFLSNLNHEHIVEFEEHWISKEENNISIVMEYVDGGNLSDFINYANKRNLCIEEKVIIFKEIL
jgi:serine/threonine protein kinase